MHTKAKLRAETVRRILARRNLPQKWLTSRLQTSSGYMSQLMNGARNPSPTMRNKIMNVLGVQDFDELFCIKR